MGCNPLKYDCMPKCQPSTAFVVLAKTDGVTLKVPSANQKLDFSSTRSISRSPNKIILSWSFCPLSNLINFLKSSGISKLLVAGESGKASSRCLRTRCAAQTTFFLVGRASWVAMSSVCIGLNGGSDCDGWAITIAHILDIFFSKLVERQVWP